jgi:hypothetical protein
MANTFRVRAYAVRVRPAQAAGHGRVIVAVVTLLLQILAPGVKERAET